MTFTYRAPWVHWPIAASLWIAGLFSCLGLSVWLLSVFEIERDSDVAIRIVTIVTQASIEALVAVVTIKCVRLADRFCASHPIVLTEDGIVFVSVDGIERRVRWADVKSLTEDFRTDTIMVVFKRQVASEIDSRRRSDEWVRFAKDRIAPSADAFFAQAQRLMDEATASLPKDRHVEYRYHVR